MELDFRHSELLTNPIHLLAIHLGKQYGYCGETSTSDTFLLHLYSIYLILSAVARETPFNAQIPGIVQINCCERVLSLFNHLRKTDRSCNGLVSGLRPIPPEGGRPRQARCFAFALSSFRRAAAQEHASCLACAHFSETQALMLAPKARALGLRLPECRLVPRRGFSAKSTVCGLNGFLPSGEPDGTLHLNPRPSGFPRLLRFRLFAPCPNGNSRFRFGKKNCALGAHFFSPKRNPKDSSGEKGENKGQWPNPAPAGRRPLHQNRMFYVEHSINLKKHAYYYER